MPITQEAPTAPERAIEPPTSSTTIEREPRRQLRPRVYLTSLAAMNAGQARGLWLDADRPATELEQQLQAFVDSSPTPEAPDWGIHSATDFAGLELEPQTPLDVVSRVGQGLVRYGAPFVGLVRAFGLDAADGDNFAGRYLGTWPSVRAYAAELVREFDLEQHLERLPAVARPYVLFDLDALTRDLVERREIAYAAAEDGVYVFLDQERG